MRKSSFNFYKIPLHVHKIFWWPWCMDWATVCTVQNPDNFGCSKLVTLSSVTLQKYSTSLWCIESCDIHLVFTLCILSVRVYSFCTSFGGGVLGQSWLLYSMHGGLRQVSRCHHCLASIMICSNLTFLEFPCTWKSIFRFPFSIHSRCYSCFNVALPY